MKSGLSDGSRTQETQTVTSQVFDPWGTSVLPTGVSLESTRDPRPGYLWPVEAGTICCVVVLHEANVRPSRFKFNEDEMSLYLTGDKDQLLWAEDSAG